MISFISSSDGLDEKSSEYKKSYYIPRYFRSSWVNSRSICIAYGFDIASFETQQEANAVVNLCKKQPNLLEYFTYIGAIKISNQQSNGWYWVNSGKKLSFEIPEENLDFAGREEWCLALGPANNFLLNDVHCNGYEFKFLCQKVEFML